MKRLLFSNTLSALFIIVFAVVLRLVPHPPNFAPIGAMALFGGVYLNKKYALVVPIAAMFVSDMLIGFHRTMGFVYGSFLLTGLIGLWIKNHKRVGYIVGASLMSSVLFFLITNFGVWLTGSLYPKTFDGFMQCYLLAVPFFRNTLIGDLFYTALFFGAYEVILEGIRRYENLYAHRR